MYIYIYIYIHIYIYICIASRALWGPSSYTDGYRFPGARVAPQHRRVSIRFPKDPIRAEITYGQIRTNNLWIKHNL